MSPLARTVKVGTTEVPQVHMGLLLLSAPCHGMFSSQKPLASPWKECVCAWMIPWLYLGKDSKHMPVTMASLPSLNLEGKLSVVLLRKRAQEQRQDIILPAGLERRHSSLLGTKYHRLGGFNNRNLLFHHPGS